MREERHREDAVPLLLVYIVASIVIPEEPEAVYVPPPAPPAGTGAA